MAEFPEGVLVEIAFRGPSTAHLLRIREADTSLMTEGGEVRITERAMVIQRSAHDDVGQFAWHYDHFYDLLARNCCLDFFGRQGSFADYGLR